MESHKKHVSEGGKSSTPVCDVKREREGGCMLKDYLR